MNKGLLAFAESNLQGDHLARIMVRMDLMQREKMKEIASLMKAGKTSEEAILDLTNSDLAAVEKGRRDQAIYILASLWAWNGCNIHLYTGEGLVRNGLDLGMSLPELIVLSVRRAVSDRLVHIPSNFLSGRCSIAKDMESFLGEYPLNSAEISAYSTLQQNMKAVDAFPQISLAGEKPEEVFFRLSVLGLIIMKEPGVQSEAPSEPDASNPFVRKIEDMLLRFETASLYEILSVPKESNSDKIQTAYHDLAKQFHPDRFHSKEYSVDLRRKVEQVFGFINEAHATLRNPAARAEYDEKQLKKENEVEVELKARAGGQADDKKMAEALFKEGRMLLANKDFEKAVERLKGCVWLHPEKAAYHHYLGVAMAKIPIHRKSAEQHLLKAIELDTMSTGSHLELAKLYIEVKLRRKAELQLQELMRWDPDNPKAQKLITELKKLTR